MAETVTAVAYLIIEGKRATDYWGRSSGQVRDAKIVGIRQGKPSVLEGDQIALKVRVKVPKDVFEAYEPEAELVLSPADLFHPTQIEAIQEPA